MQNIFNANSIFKNVYVKGEVSGTYISSIGHLYFTLKDKRSKVPCIVYRQFRQDIGFDIEDGMNLLVTANVAVYPPHGKYQLDVRSATDDGLGRLFIVYQQLRKKLDKEGLFDDVHKKELPDFPKRIGVVTSRGGSVIHDIIKTVEGEWPYCEVLLFPAAVQGPKSKQELVTQIRKADDFGLDVLIVARGGGSLEELQSYNEEIVARTVFNCKTPIISAIGHEDDVTLCDLVADRRASTPTMAASMAIQNRDDVQNHINHLNSRLLTFIHSKLNANRKEYENILSKPLFRDSTYVYLEKKSAFDNICNRFDAVSGEIVNSGGYMLDKIKQEYVIRHPCKMQFDTKSANLNELKSRLIDSMNIIINEHKVNLDKVADNFKFQSKNFLTSRRHSLEMSKSYIMTNPCQNRIDMMRNSLEVNEEKLNREMALKMKSNRKDFEVMLDKPILRNPQNLFFNMSKEFDRLVDKFVYSSRQLIRENNHRLDSLKSKHVIANNLDDYLKDYQDELDIAKLNLEKSFSSKVNENRKDLSFILSNNLFMNPEIIYKRGYDELNKVKTSDLIQNPYILLDDYRRELNVYEDKLDKINQVLMLKKEQQKQKRTYILIIVAIVVAVILLIIFGGIL